MSYRDTARAFVAAERGNPTDAKALPVSEWSESRRDLMTPQTVAANHFLHVSDRAFAVRNALAFGGDLETPVRALLEAIGEADA